jgi:RimJ/RimL family protein N-acetyltransferase
MRFGFLQSLMKPPELYSERLYYVPLSLNHLSQQYVNWLNDLEVYRYLETGGDYSIEKLEDFLKDIETKDMLFWAVHLKSNNKHIGNIKIDPINERHNIGEYGIMFGDRSEWGKGFATEASKRIIDFCFTEKRLRKITLGVVADNTSAVELYKKLGFIVEGTYRKHAFHDGRYCDVLRMAIFNPGFVYDE